MTRRGSNTFLSSDLSQTFRDLRAAGWRAHRIAFGGFIVTSTVISASWWMLKTQTNARGRGRLLGRRRMDEERSLA
jgi:hypothetical protein